ncbi:MAG TPA: hypothetical protein VFN10_09700 [Thermoanaerobaculia bacterium]|nr:hypothetical protein [Thermoanaerobaculia bacterium]
MHDSVIVDASRNLAVIGTPAGAIEAIDVASGRSVWASSDAVLPLGVNGDVILARGIDSPPRARLPLIVLDANGRTIRTAFAPLPEEVVALVQDDLSRRFRATATPQGNGFVVTWTFFELEMRGSADAADREPESGQFSGSFRFEPASGAIASLNVPDEAGAVQRGAWRSGRVLASVEGGRGEALVLRRQDSATGQQISDEQISRHAIADLRSSDGAFVMVSERVGAGGPDDPEYRWSVWSLDTGAKAMELRRDVSATPFFVASETLVYVAHPHGKSIGGVWVDEPLKLEALRLSNGTPQWQRAIRDVRYTGEVPPGRGR